MIDISWITKIAFRALRANKMRSALTMLGIIIGVGAVIAMLAVGTGASRQITAQIAGMGSNLLSIQPGSLTSGGARMGMGTQSTLTMDDAAAIQKECSAVAEVSPYHHGVAQIVYGNLNWSTDVQGTTPNMLIVRDWQIASGTMFTDDDIRGSTKVAVLGQSIVDNLFGGIDPLGQIIRIKKVPFKVVGVLVPKGQSANGRDQDDTLWVPVTTAKKKLFGTPFLGQVAHILVKARSLEGLGLAEQQVNDLLLQRHRISARRDADFQVRNLTEIMESAEQSTKVMTLLLGAIASVSLVVGGIGIMNIMLVSVTERTREIGIRMAVGARTWDIRLQFVMEAVILSLMGGVAGIGVGVSASELISIVAGWPTVVSPVSALLAFIFSGIVGVFFGFYPAYKASLLNPIDALRYE
jgi:putative ABC transport system permease protein